MINLRKTLVVVLTILLSIPLFATPSQRKLELLKGNSSSIIENVLKRKNTRNRSLKVENTTPNAQTYAYTWGTLDHEDGTTWYFTQSFVERSWYLESSEIVIYNNDFEEMAKINIEVPEDMNVNDISPIYCMTSQFFDTDEQSLEIPVFVHAVDNGAQINKVYIYNLAGEKVQEYDTRSMIYFTADNDYRRMLLVNEINGEMIVDVLSPAQGDAQPVSEHQFVIDQDLLYYSDGPALSYYTLDGKPYYSVAHFEKPCMDGIDMETYIPTQTPDNYLVIKTYDQEYQMLDSLKVSIAATDETATYGFASLGMLTYSDVRLGEFTGDNQRNYIITHYEYFAHSDEFIFHFKVYDQEGNHVKTIVENTSSWLALSNIEGCEEQMAFVKIANNSQVFEMIDMPSCNVAASLPAVIDGYRISTNIDRYPVGDSYQYVIGLAQADENANGEAIARIGWYNIDTTVDHYVEFNLGKNAEGFTPYIASYVLDPYLFNTDSKREYFYLAMNKRTDGSEVLDKTLYLADEDGKVLRTIKPENGDEIEFSSGDIFDYYTSSPKMVLSFYNGEKDAFEIQHFNLPFDAFTSGGDGSQDNPYVITTPAELAQMYNYPHASFVLGNDIDMSQYTRPYVAPAEFGCTFDGNNYFISNIKLNNSGLFGILHHGTVKNLQLQSPVLNIGDNNKYISMGIIANSSYRANIENVHIYDACIYGNGDNRNSVGGILGQGEYTEINAVSMLRANDLYQINNFGGIVGYMNSSNINAAVATGRMDYGKNFGGIASHVSCSDIRNAHTEFALLLPQASGGIVGVLDGGTFDATVQYCYSTSYAYGELQEGSPVHDFQDIVYTNIDGTINGCVGNDEMETNRAFFEALGFAYGNTLDAPWEGEGVPVLYFENERNSTPVIEYVDNGVIFNGTTVVVADAHKIALYNMQGQLVVTIQGTTLDVSNIAKGIYVVVATDAQSDHITRKIAIQ